MIIYIDKWPSGCSSVSALHWKPTNRKKEEREREREGERERERKARKKKERKRKRPERRGELRRGIFVTINNDLANQSIQSPGEAASSLDWGALGAG